MTVRDYSLATLRKLREDEETRAADELARRIHTLSLEEDRVKTCAARLTDHERETRERFASESHSAATGESIRQLGLWETRRRAEQEMLRKSLATQRDAVRVAESSVAEARQLLIEANAASQAVENHFEEWVESEKAKAEKKAEDEVADLVGRKSVSNLP